MPPEMSCFRRSWKGRTSMKATTSRSSTARRAADLRKVLQGGEQAPGCEAGVYVDFSSGTGFGGMVSDNGTLCVAGDLGGPGVTSANDRAMWTGTRENLELVYREGMQAPGCAAGVHFAAADFVAHNDAGQISFRGSLLGGTCVSETGWIAVTPELTGA